MTVELIFDIETDGLLDELTCIHSLVIQNVGTGAMLSCARRRPGDTEEIRHGLQQLAEADTIIGHNIIGFDLPAIKKVYGGFSTRAQVVDTLVCTRLIWPEIGVTDAARQRRGSDMPPRLVGSHSLDAWGHRLGVWKGDFGKQNAWDVWSPEMQRYCEQDVIVTRALFQKIVDSNVSAQALELEHKAAEVCREIEAWGFPFDHQAAAVLYSNLVGRRAEIDDELKSRFGGWYRGREIVTPKKTIRYKDPLRGDRLEGAPFQRVEYTEFNPGSRQHIADRLQTLYGWQPVAKTDGGQPQLDERVLSALDPTRFPEAPLLAERFLLQKRVGQVAEGPTAWLRLERKGRLHGAINSCGAVTGRATHHSPNIAQVPRSGSPYGRECRACFKAPFGWLLVGTDMSGLELRCLSHFMHPVDGGAYGKAVIEGNSADGTDVHSLNARALGFDPKEQLIVRGKPTTGRDVAKTFIYAFLYGAGDEKLGSIVGGSKRRGAQLRASFQDAVPALASLVKAVRRRAAQRGWLRGLDERRLAVRSEHSALNTLLQSAGALACKQWMFNLRHILGCHYEPGGDFQFHAWVHDELQISARTTDIAHDITELTDWAARQAGERFGFRVPLAADATIGQTWADTH